MRCKVHCFLTSHYPDQTPKLKSRAQTYQSRVLIQVACAGTLFRFTPFFFPAPFAAVKMQTSHRKNVVCIGSLTSTSTYARSETDLASWMCPPTASSIKWRIENEGAKRNLTRANKIGAHGHVSGWEGTTTSAQSQFSVGTSIGHTSTGCASRRC